MMDYTNITRSFIAKVFEIVNNAGYQCFIDDNNPTDLDAYVHILGTSNMTDILYTEHQMLLSIYSKNQTDEQAIMNAFTPFLQEYSFGVYNYSDTSEKIGTIVINNWQIENAGYNDNGYKVITIIMTLKYKEVAV